MNQYFKSNDTIYELTQAYPETIAILVSNGFENMQNAAMRESLGKTITLDVITSYSIHYTKLYEGYPASCGRQFKGLDFNS